MQGIDLFFAPDPGGRVENILTDYLNAVDLSAGVLFEILSVFLGGDLLGGSVSRPHRQGLSQQSGQSATGRMGSRIGFC